MIATPRMCHSQITAWAAVVALAFPGCSGGGGGGVVGHATVGPATLAEQVVELTRGFPDSVRAGYMVECADVDGDVDVDVFFGSKLYLNDGNGVFSELPGAVPQISNPNQAPTRAAFGDLDGDGDADLLVSSFGASLLWRNDGTGHFEDATAGNLPSTTTGSGDVTLGDLDRDGDLDVVVGHVGSGGGRVYLNNGVGVFTDATLAWLPPVSSGGDIALADFDGDLDLDLVLDFGRTFLRNHGQGFAVDPTANLPATHYWVMGVGDLDGDGDLDLLMSLPSRWDPPNALLLNDGTGHFVDRTSQLPASVGSEHGASVSIADVDGDGDQDVVLVCQSKLFTNNGAGMFTASDLHLSPSCVENSCLTDVDSDGDADLVVGSQVNFGCQFPGPQLLLLNDGHGAFRWVRTEPYVRLEWDGVDIDGDLDLDVVYNDGSVRVSDPAGVYTLVTGRFSPPVTGYRFVVGDIDGNGSPDAVFFPAVSVYRNDGHGFFTRVPGPAVSDTQAVELTDVDHDGDLDLVCGRASNAPASRQTVLLLNDGTGGFTDVTATHMPADNEITSDLAAGDVDRDGDRDLVLSSTWGSLPQTLGRIRLYLNRGNGVFDDATAARMPGGNARFTSVALVDLEGDLDLDVTMSGGSGVCFYRNDGGVFVDASASVAFCGTSGSTISVSAADLDTDGDLDVIVGGESAVEVFLQDAPLQFRHDPRSTIVYSGVPPMLVGGIPFDADLDGDLEWANRSNLARHLHAPGVATVSHPYRLEVFARPGWLARDHLAQVFVSFDTTATLTVPSPFGAFGLGTLGLTALPPVTIPAPVGSASVSFAIPGIPALVSLPIYAQALITDPTTGVGRFTNRTVDTIGP